MPRSTKRHRWLLFGSLALQVLSCTLTDDPFTPSELAPLAPEADGPRSSAASALEPQPMAAPTLGSGACTSASELPGCPQVQIAPAACVRDGDCESLHCQAGSCVAARCDDGIVNQGESATDCAGPCAARCREGQACTAAADCAAGLYCSEDAHTCTRSSCRDGVRNGQERGTDCGGGCPACPVGTACTAHSDCATGVCRAGSCAVPSCDDGIRNQDEAELDCGGVCAPCAPGRSCQLGADCDTGVCEGRGCDNGVARCCQPARCDDGVQNGAERFPDCGDAQCGACPIDSPCAVNADCSSGLCQTGVCRPLPCRNGRMDGLETDTDCGGADAACARCALGRACVVTADCAAGSCVSGICADCANGVQDGRETGSDCGGVCGPCAAGVGCQLDSECQSGVCADQRCCGGRDVDCTRCARRLGSILPCNIRGEAVALVCNGLLQCYADHPEACPTRLAAGCTDAGGVCDVLTFGGNSSEGVQLSDRILGTAQCSF